MRRVILLAVLGLLVPGAAQCADTGEAGVRAAFMQYDKGWRDFDTNEVLATLAPDIEWTNSVGIRLHGTEEMRRLLNHLFKDASFRAGKPGPLTIHAIRMLGPDAAVVSSSEATFNQVDTRTGKPVPDQHTNELSVMEKRDGHWLIVNDLTSDESHGI
ncbi:MAG TPA: SgcJ/EcaC family oxidoreductase [Rhizomicrobium sp.]|jgi:uncharacterized protein (TIGR02246 family)